MKSLFLETETLHPSFDSISFDFGLFDTFKQTDNVIGGLWDVPHGYTYQWGKAELQLSY